MDTQKQTILIVGICLAVAVYLIFKFFQWRKSQAMLHPQPKKRAAAASRPVSTGLQQPVESPLAASIHEDEPLPVKASTPYVPPVFVPPVPAPQTKLQEAIEATRLVEQPQPTYPEKRSPVPSNNWSQEPVHSNRRSVMEEIEEEYPYADTSDYVFGGATPVMASFVPTSDEGRIADTKTLRNAGYYTPHAWHNFTAVRYLGIILPVVFFGVMLLLVPERLEPMMMIGLIVGPILGWGLPKLLVQSRATSRLREIGNGMPDMLDLLNMCVSQGMTVSTALGRVGKEIQPVYPALSKELSIVTEQARIGNLSQALNNFSSRVDVPEVHSFTSLLTQTEQMGTSVSEALIEHSDSMRETIRQRADEKANSATFKLLFPTVLCLMPAVFMFLLGPATVEMNRFYQEGGPQVLNPTVPQRFIEQ